MFLEWLAKCKARGHLYRIVRECIIPGLRRIDQVRIEDETYGIE